MEKGEFLRVKELAARQAIRLAGGEARPQVGTKKGGKGRAKACEGLATKP